MRWLLALILMLSLVACSSGDDGDDSDGDGDDATPTIVEATPTEPSTPTATIAPSPTPEPTVTPTTAPPTPTRRPATVVTTPRPLAPTATSPAIVPDPTEAPADPDDDGVTIVIDETFDDPAASLFFTGETEYGVVAAIDSGFYSLTVPEETWQTIVAVDAGEFGDAVALVDAAFQGEGAFGIVSRWVANEDGTWNFYVCWLQHDGRAGCHVSVASEWVELFSVAAGTVPLQDVNELVVTSIGDQLFFDVNDIEIGSIQDSTVSIGAWGVYTESFIGTSVSAFDRVTVATIDP